LNIWKECLNLFASEIYTPIQSEKYLGKKRSKALFVLEIFWRDFSFGALPEQFDCVERGQIRRDEDELNAEFVGPLLGEFRVVRTIVVGHEQNPPRFGMAAGAIDTITPANLC